ncbi:MAG: hypothetical protein H6Q84_2238 [Deltaproteobacteria bacterium]|nr:hypothetical protein [Deltaproteobacteria bacterium]
MRDLLLAILVLAAFAVPAAADGKPKPEYTRLLDGSRDEVVRAEFVPSEEQPVGEVRLVRRGGAVVMQTVLYTALLKRVVAEIRKKETAAWPPARPGHSDAMKYVEAVQSSQAGIQERFRSREDRGDRRQRMLIEFILSEKASIVAIAEPALAEEGGSMRVVARRHGVVLPLSRAYVRGNIYEIAWDALKIPRKESRDLLEPMLPPESRGEGGPSEGEGKQGGSP